RGLPRLFGLRRRCASLLAVAIALQRDLFDLADDDLPLRCAGEELFEPSLKFLHVAHGVLGYVAGNRVSTWRGRALPSSAHTWPRLRPHGDGSQRPQRLDGRSSDANVEGVSGW